MIRFVESLASLRHCTRHLAAIAAGDVRLPPWLRSQRLATVDCARVAESIDVARCSTTASSDQSSRTDRINANRGMCEAGCAIGIDKKSTRCRTTLVPEKPATQWGGKPWHNNHRVR